MSSDRTVRDLTRLLTQMDARIRALEQGARTGQLQNASITGTAITVYDEDGETRRGSIGIQPDGTIGFVAEGGPAPLALSAPVVTASLAGLRVVWDGTFADGSAVPADFSHAAVHVSTTSGFTPSAATFAGTITLAGDGGMLPVVPLPYQTHYVVLVGVNTSGIAGPASAEASGTPLRVDGPDLTAGSVTAGAIAAGAVTADKLEAILSIVNRIVAGDSAGARVEMNAAGLRVYDAAGVETVRFDSTTGDAVFTGVVDGSSIVGGSLITDGTGTNVKIYTDGTTGVVGFPTDSPVEGDMAKVLSGRVNVGAVNEFLALNLDGPKADAPSDANVQIQLNSQSADGSSNPNIGIKSLASSGETLISTMDKGAVNFYVPVSLWGASFLGLRGTSVTKLVLAAAMNTDPQWRFKLDQSGTMRWGDGTATSDVALYRGFVDGTPQLETDSKFYAPTYGYSWASGSPLLTIASGWTLDSSYGIKVGGTIHVMASVHRTSTALTADAAGNMADTTIFTLLAGWRPNSSYGAARLPFAASDGFADGALLLDADVGTLKIVSWTPSQSIPTGNTLRIAMSYPV